MTTELAIRSGAPIQGPPGPLAALTGTWGVVQTPPLVDADGGLDAEERSEWSDR